jgi:serine phosphatase RsbU (regulator of sigma subunit)
VLYTDGITEAKNDSLDDFGEEYFTKLLVENNETSANELAKRVIKEVTLFSKDHSQYDDITLVILKWKQKIKINGEKEWQNSAPQL